MRKKILLLSLLLSILFVFQIAIYQTIVYASVLPSIVVNDELKQCTWFTPGEYLLPDDWRNSGCDYNNINKCCSELGYEVVDIELKGERSFYGISALCRRIIYFAILGIIIFLSYRTVKKEKTKFAKVRRLIICLSLILIWLFFYFLTRSY